MKIDQAYTQWSAQYDTNTNKTRDLEGQALREILNELPFKSVLEIGCGTGKNTEWFITKAKEVTAVDFSEGMLALAKGKIQTDKVTFKQADITHPWKFAEGKYDLVSFSLVLEHIEDLNFVFEQAVTCLKQGGHLYLGELHPFKQYSGTKARFETEQGTQVVTCCNHNLTDFTDAALSKGLELVHIGEHFDDGDRTTIPRVLTMVFRK